MSENLRAICASGELLEEATIRNFRIVQREVARSVAFYRLAAIISVGYRQFPAISSLAGMYLNIREIIRKASGETMPAPRGY